MMAARVNASLTGKDLSKDFKKDVLPVTVFISIEALIGFFGNITILLVYFCRYRKINFRYFVLALAVVDLTSCCTTLPGEVISQLNWYDYEYEWICKVKSFFNVYTAWGSASILLALAIDRYRKICHPCDWQIRYSVAFRLCGCCLIASALVSTPVFILWGKQTFILEHEGKNITVSVCEKSGEYADTIYPLLYICGVYLVPVSIMILVAMALNVVTARRLFGHHSMKTASIKHHTKKAFVTITLTTETSDEGTCDDREMKIMTGEHRAEKFKDANLYLSAKRQGYQSFKGNGKSSDVGNIVDVEGKSKNDLSNDDEYTDDYISGNDEIGSSSFDLTSSDHSKRTSRRRRRSKTKTSKFKRKSKTMIMLILTTIFAVTLAIYIILTSLVAKPDGILKHFSDSQKAAFFFFWRFYFVNSVVNPILYGFLDPGFRSGFMYYMRRNKNSVTSST